MSGELSDGNLHSANRCLRFGGAKVSRFKFREPLVAPYCLVATTSSAWQRALGTTRDRGADMRKFILVANALLAVLWLVLVVMSRMPGQDYATDGLHGIMIF